MCNHPSSYVFTTLTSAIYIFMTLHDVSATTFGRKAFCYACAGTGFATESVMQQKIELYVGGTTMSMMKVTGADIQKHEHAKFDIVKELVTKLRNFVQDMINTNDQELQHKKKLQIG